MKKIKKITNLDNSAVDHYLKINELIDAINEMSEGCGHDTEQTVMGMPVKIRNYVPENEVWIASELELFKIRARSNAPEDKQEDEEEVRQIIKDEHGFMLIRAKGSEVIEMRRLSTQNLNQGA